MKTNGWVASSQRLYRWLLQLYPQEYRANYELEMFRLFTDQCQEAYKQRGRLGILSLWLRTLVDVGVSAIREHLSDPNSKVGLLEAAPNAPLPWKGVLLVLIPGLIFFASQVEQVTSGNDWFFLAFYRAGYFLILPVLLVWLLARRFPVWGLIPLGLLYRTVWGYSQHFNLGRLPFIGHFFANDIVVVFGQEICVCDVNYFLIVLVCIVLLTVLIRHDLRHGQIPSNAWRWLGLYGLLVVLSIAGELYSYLSWVGSDGITLVMILEPILSNLNQSLPFLLLIFIGTLFAPRQGGLAFLVLLGYLLPIIVFGRYGNDQVIPFYMVSLAVLLYRFFVALVAPVWLVRAVSVSGRQRAAAIPVAVAIACDVAIGIIFSLAWANKYGAPAVLLDSLLEFLPQLILAAGLGLAVALYLPREKEQTPASPPTLVATAE